MGSQALSILRQGVWASLTGGWYYDPRQSHVSNVIHLYIWLFLLILPIGTQFLINVNGNKSILLWTTYCTIIACIFIIIKVLNWYLHQVFDKGECVAEEALTSTYPQASSSTHRTVPPTAPPVASTSTIVPPLAPLTSSTDDPSYGPYAHLVYDVLHRSNLPSHSVTVDGDGVSSEITLTRHDSHEIPVDTVVITSPIEPRETSVIVHHHDECSTSHKSTDTTSSVDTTGPSSNLDCTSTDRESACKSGGGVDTEEDSGPSTALNSDARDSSSATAAAAAAVRLRTSSTVPQFSRRLFDVSIRSIEVAPSIILSHVQETFAAGFMDIHSSETSTCKRKQYYKLWLPPKLNWTYIKLRFDRLQLLALFDNNVTNFELCASIVLAVIVAILGSIIMHLNVFKDITFYIFTFVIASCQYTLLKSVQPDAASPTHGYNRTIIFSRPIYFSIVSCIIIATHFILIGRNDASSTASSSSHHEIHFTLYGVDIFSTYIIHVIYSTAKIFILTFPVIFSFGLLPQIDTFVTYLLEQIEIHVFGGTAATTGLSSAVFAFTRSLCVLVLLYVLALLSLHRVFHHTKQMKIDFTFNSYDVAFSVFCGIMVAFAYLLSRSSSDATVLFRLIRRFTVWINATSTQWCASFSLKSATQRNQLLKQRSRKQQQHLHHQSEELEMNPVNEASHLTGQQQPPPQPSKRSTLTSTTVNEVNINDAVDDDDETRSQEYADPLPALLEHTLCTRLQNDLIICVMVTIVVFATHVSTIFTLQPTVEISLGLLAFTWGLILHYFMKHSRKQLPWLCFSSPFFKSREYALYEVKDEANLMCYEYLHCWLHLIEKNAIYPLFFLSAITKDTPILLNQFGLEIGTLLSVLCTFKAIRSTLNDSSYNYIILIFTYLFFEFDLRYIRETFILNYAVSAVVFSKMYDLLLKLKFVITYVAPWQITWGSAFHAFAQPFSVPHSGMLMIQAFISAILSSPLQPILGSAIFLTSYVRPIKFWERDYNTKRVDASNIRLASQLERSQLGNDDNNLNSIFYEHLTRSLQTSLYGDLELGRWGQVSQGDCFILASENLNCLVHIIELGNGLVTFQVRGLEFRGTYCQQREVEALSEDVSEDEGCCCCEPGHLPNVLSINAAFNLRWLAWEVTHTKYVLEGYSISDNSAVSFLQAYELRKALISYYVKSVIFYTIINKRLTAWISNEAIIESLEHLTSDDFVDLDPTFNPSVDDDFDIRHAGITRSSFCRVYSEWIQFCLKIRPRGLINRHQSSSCSSTAAFGSNQMHTAGKADAPSMPTQSTSHNYKLYQETTDADSENSDIDLTKVTTLCFALSLIARRALSAASHNNTFSSVEFLLFGLHALFKGDLRITSPRDEWVFLDMELLKQVIAPSVRMAVKLHHDHIATEDYDDPAFLYASIENYEKNIVISHEADPVWRNAVLSNVPSLLALRHVSDEGNDKYKFVMLNKRYLSFRVIKVNKECVRGLWAGQQQELIYLRNRNPERGSIQNAKQALRNIINSSCDQPIGYPIYVSPLTTSYAETSHQLCRVIGNPFTFNMFKIAAVRFWTRTKIRFGQGCSGDITTASASGGGGGGISGTHHLHRSSDLNLSSSLTRQQQSSSSASSHAALYYDPLSHRIIARNSKDVRCKLETRRSGSSRNTANSSQSTSSSHHRHTSQGTPVLMGYSRQWGTSEYTVRPKSGSSRTSRRRNSSSSNSSTLVNVTSNVNTSNPTEMPLLASSSVTEENTDATGAAGVAGQVTTHAGDSSDDSLPQSTSTSTVPSRYSRKSRDAMSQV